ncbi:hypothetical protein CBR_g78852 [Chara braunii]|uniref:Uncharacterized protein n=1 Tax=Chara braunii TaxID=69332 RepID=A0A388KAL9_CHABU|nr:hypothetical protein CBR_g78852 [Chara braunii]|eukprot:GBG67071.1 hypothetical protein CBR_g78852 [Chara braunii]
MKTRAPPIVNETRQTVTSTPDITPTRTPILDFLWALAGEEVESPSTNILPTNVPLPLSSCEDDDPVAGDDQICASVSGYPSVEGAGDENDDDGAVDAAVDGAVDGDDSISGFSGFVVPLDRVRDVDDDDDAVDGAVDGAADDAVKDDADGHDSTPGFVDPVDDAGDVDDDDAGDGDVDGAAGGAVDDAIDGDDCISGSVARVGGADDGDDDDDDDDADGSVDDAVDGEFHEGVDGDGIDDDSVDGGDGVNDVSVNGAFNGDGNEKENSFGGAGDGDGCDGLLPVGGAGVGNAPLHWCSPSLLIDSSNSLPFWIDTYKWLSSLSKATAPIMHPPGNLKVHLATVSTLIAFPLGLSKATQTTLIAPSSTKNKLHPSCVSTGSPKLTSCAKLITGTGLPTESAITVPVTRSMVPLSVLNPRTEALALSLAYR